MNWTRRNSGAHILEGLIIAVDNLDEVIRLIRQSQKRQAGQGRPDEPLSGELTSKAQAILDLRLQRLTGLEILTLRKSMRQSKAPVAGKSILGNEKLLMSLIKEEAGNGRQIRG